MDSHVFHKQLNNSNMLKHLKSVGMLLFLSTISGGAVYASSGERVTGIDAVQQNGTCTGVVKDGTGETVIGASVVVKGSTNGTITDRKSTRLNSSHIL